MKLLTLTIASIICLTSLGGCHSSSNHNNVSSDANTDNDSNTDSVVDNQLKALSAQMLDNEPRVLDNTTLLQNDINTLFNGIDPVEVETGDNLQDVINRSGGS